MKHNFVFRNFSIFVLLAFLLSACGGAPLLATATATNTATANPTQKPTSTAIPPTPTEIPPKETHIIIDGHADDWSNYLVNLTDPQGDQVASYADITEARFFANDKYLYILIVFDQLGTVENFNIPMRFEFGANGGAQFTFRPNGDMDLGMDGESAIPIFALFAIGDAIEIKITLSDLPAPLENISQIRFYGAVEGDSASPQIPLQYVKEEEPALALNQQPKPGAARFELTAEDGLPLIGYYYPSRQTNAPLVLLIHQYGLNQEKWLEYGMVDWLQNWPPTGAAQGLFPAMSADQSFAVLTVDLRGFGESGPLIPSNLSDEQAVAYGQAWIAQVKQVLAYAKTLPGVDSSRIAIIAANNGADASVAACGDCLGVLALSPGNYFYVDFKAAVETLDAQGKIVWCFSTTGSEGQDVATCASVSGAHYYTENFPGDGRGMQLIRDDKAPEGIGLKIMEYLQLVFGIKP